jgi:hypothetical protein
MCHIHVQVRTTVCNKLVCHATVMESTTKPRPAQPVCTHVQPCNKGLWLPNTACPVPHPVPHPVPDLLPHSAAEPGAAAAPHPAPDPAPHPAPALVRAVDTRCRRQKCRRGAVRRWTWWLPNKSSHVLSNTQC